MSAIVLNEQLIDKSLIKTAKIEIDRIKVVNMGVRLWFVIEESKGVRYQRWSMLMNPTDEVLMLAEAGDYIDITYIDDKVEDPINNTVEPYDRKVILTAEQCKPK